MNYKKLRYFAKAILYESGQSDEAGRMEIDRLVNLMAEKNGKEDLGLTMDASYTLPLKDQAIYALNKAYQILLADDERSRRQEILDQAGQFPGYKP